MTHLADVNHPGSQEDVLSSWEPAHSLVEDAISGAEIVAALCLPNVYHKGFLVAQRLKLLPEMRETGVRSLGQEDPLEKEMAKCGSQQTVENSSRDGNTRPPELPPEQSVCRSRNNS